MDFLEVASWHVVRARRGQYAPIEDVSNPINNNAINYLQITHLFIFNNQKIILNTPKFTAPNTHNVLLNIQLYQFEILEFVVSVPTTFGLCAFNDWWLRRTPPIALHGMAKSNTPSAVQARASKSAVPHIRAHQNPKMNTCWVNLSIL